MENNEPPVTSATATAADTEAHDGEPSAKPGSSKLTSRASVPPEIAAEKILKEAMVRESEDLKRRFTLIDNYIDVVKLDSSSGKPWENMSYADLKKQNAELQNLLSDIKELNKKERRESIIEEQDLQDIITQLKCKYEAFKLIDAPTVKPLVEMQELSEGIKEALEKFMKETDELTQKAEEEVANDFDSTLKNLARKIADEKSRSPNDDVFIWQRHLHRIENEMTYYRKEIENENNIIAKNKGLIEQAEMDIEEMEQQRELLDKKYANLTHKKNLQTLQKQKKEDEEIMRRRLHQNKTQNIPQFYAADPSVVSYNELKKRNTATVSNFLADIDNLEKCANESSYDRRRSDDRESGINMSMSSTSKDFPSKVGEPFNNDKYQDDMNSFNDQHFPKSSRAQFLSSYPGESEELRKLDWRISTTKENIMRVEDSIASLKNEMDVLREDILTIDKNRKKNIDILMATLQDVRTLLNTVGGKSEIDRDFVDRTIENSIQGGLGVNARLHLLNYLYDNEELKQMLINFGYEL